MPLTKMNLRKKKDYDLIQNVAKAFNIDLSPFDHFKTYDTLDFSKNITTDRNYVAGTMIFDYDNFETEVKILMEPTEKKKSDRGFPKRYELFFRAIVSVIIENNRKVGTKYMTSKGFGESIDFDSDLQFDSKKFEDYYNEFLNLGG